LGDVHISKGAKFDAVKGAYSLVSVFIARPFFTIRS
jgi:hypothetical protein